MKVLFDTLPASQTVNHTSDIPHGAVGLDVDHANQAVVDRVSRLSRFCRLAASELARSLREHSLVVVAVGIYCVVGRLVPIWAGVSNDYTDRLYSGLFFIMVAAAAVLFVIAYAIHLRLVVKPRDFLGTLKLDLFCRFLTVRRMCVVLPIIVLMPFFGATFTNLKMLIPAIQPFSWDPTFAEWDQLIHGGYHPWEWLQPVLGHPVVTSFISAVYVFWFLVAWGVLLWQVADTRRPRLRMQYLLTFLLVWALIGNAAATVLSSAGPVYYGRVTGLADPFVPLMEYLRQASESVPVPALAVQEMLWQAYVAKGIAVGGGISAMPSLHVAIAFLFFLIARTVNRQLAAAAAVFTFLILLGSVHLGWHYAIDGYVAIPLTWGIWCAVDWLLRRPRIAEFLGFAESSLSVAPTTRSQWTRVPQ